jgi:hypothetical protein
MGAPGPSHLGTGDTEKDHPPILAVRGYSALAAKYGSRNNASKYCP